MISSQHTMISPEPVLGLQLIDMRIIPPFAGSLPPNRHVFSFQPDWPTGVYKRYKGIYQGKHKTVKTLDQLNPRMKITNKYTGVMAPETLSTYQIGMLLDLQRQDVPILPHSRPSCGRQRD